MHLAARQFIGVYNGEIVAHTGVIQFPMRKGWKRIHRLVVLPDYQGIGIGVKFINAVAGIISSEGNNVNLTTTTPALVSALKKKKEWLLVRRGVSKNTFHKWSDVTKIHLSKSGSDNRPTFSFNFKRIKND